MHKDAVTYPVKKAPWYPFSRMVQVFCARICAQVHVYAEGTNKILHRHQLLRHIKEKVRRKMNFTCVRVCGGEGRGKSLSGQYFFVCEKDDREESSTKHSRA